jgi:carboxymethylenebutenolidase
MGSTIEPPPAQDQWWWDEAWWAEGNLPTVDNHPLKIQWVHYKNGDIEVPAMLIRPDDNKTYPAILFQHGRRGLDEWVQAHAKRLAKRGFVVLAPDLFTARFISKFPIEHDYALETDVNAGLDYLLNLEAVSTQRACVYSHTRGGYMTLKVAVTYKRQEDALACYVSYYPHMQDPNASEAMQVYRYALEADDLTLPTLIFIGENEQYQRRRGIEMTIKSLREKKRDARLIIYPGVGRGFDFRGGNIRSFADDLASKDALQRASHFIKQHLKAFEKTK